VQILAIVPGLLVLLCLCVQSPATVFLNVYLPTLFLLPDYYRWVVPGAPDPNFHHAAILPLVAVFLATNFSRWRFSLGDLLVVGFAASVGYSEYVNIGYAEAQNLLFDQLCSVVCVYILAKGIIEPNNLRIATAKRVSLLLSGVAMSSVYEFKMAWNPYAGLLARFFPGQLNWVTTFRWGFARVAGPYGHAILAGLMFAVGFRLQRWLEWGKHWESPRKARLVSLGLAGGLFMTMCRGPWIGAACGALVIFITRANNRKRAVGTVVMLCLLAGVPTLLAMKGYLSVKRSKAVSVAQETIAYRRELLEKYVDTMLQKSEWGWGHNTWPRVPGMDSIDNQYLLLPIQHGLVSLGFFLAIFLGTGTRLCRLGVRAPRGSQESDLALTFFASYVVIASTLTSVYLGVQTVQLFFFLTGWSEGLLLKMRSGQLAAVSVATLPPPLFHFQRVMT
jgi:hypothetical protein